jgi:hypothetical protein
MIMKNGKISANLMEPGTPYTISRGSERLTAKINTNRKNKK